MDADIPDFPSDRWALTPDGDHLIVDCSTHGELGRVPAATHPQAAAHGDDEYGRAATLFRAHAATHEPDCAAPWPGPAAPPTPRGPTMTRTAPVPVANLRDTDGLPVTVSERRFLSVERTDNEVEVILGVGRDAARIDASSVQGVATLSALIEALTAVRETGRAALRVQGGTATPVDQQRLQGRDDLPDPATEPAAAEMAASWLRTYCRAIASSTALHPEGSRARWLAEQAARLDAAEAAADAGRA